MAELIAGHDQYGPCTMDEKRRAKKKKKNFESPAKILAAPRDAGAHKHSNFQVQRVFCSQNSNSLGKLHIYCDLGAQSKEFGNSEYLHNNFHVQRVHVFWWETWLRIVWNFG
jgi:hypothetical protein